MLELWLVSSLVSGEEVAMFIMSMGSEVRHRLLITRTHITFVYWIIVHVWGNFYTIHYFFLSLYIAMLGKLC